MGCDPPSSRVLGYIVVYRVRLPCTTAPCHLCKLKNQAFRNRRGREAEKQEACRAICLTSNLLHIYTTSPAIYRLVLHCSLVNPEFNKAGWQKDLQSQGASKKRLTGALRREMGSRMSEVGRHGKVYCASPRSERFLQVYVKIVAFRFDLLHTI